MFHLEEFRDSLLNIKLENESNNIIYCLQIIFKNLKDKDYNNFIDISEIINSNMNEKLDITIQEDAYEYLLNLLDKIENLCFNINNENFIKYFFKGYFNVNINFIEECTHFTNNIEPFNSIDLEVYKFVDIYASLDFLIKEELMQGEECIYCSKCKKN